MARFQIPRGVWPFTIEKDLPGGASAGQALAEGAYAFADHKVQSDLTPGRGGWPRGRIVGIVREPGDEADEAYFYLMAPSPQAKDAFAAWVTDPARLNALATFTAFETVLEPA